jgi:uncharacterized protein YbjT (DUF2867 family)
MMIFVTGASGNIGSAVVQNLQRRQIPLRIGARHLGARHPRSAVNASQQEVIPFDLLDSTTFQAAVRGCQAVFLLRPPAIAHTRTTLNVLIDVARAEGVQQIVFVSVAGAADNPLVPHHAVEQHLQQKSQGWTILRPGFFAQNLAGAYREDIVQDDRIFVPAGAGRVAFVDTRDIAEVAVTCLLDSATHQAQSYTLTGAAALSFDEVASLLSDELGRSIAYHPATILGYGLHLLRRRMPLAQVMVQTVLHVGLRFGQAEAVDYTLPRLLGRPPRRLQDYVRDYRELWLKPTSPLC